ncbi:AbiEi antitoxin N-terminal domain-containing protein [Candidatus Berkiella cookevillensis]|uniref:AbiEi antitoxin N-terminal domain-containing protein n=1 Tax=Candidatus Berkiella cookevillensis TaxID=437022 RepID=A0A0Q9Y994_9GAMM|nr:type IV toxin-antitoxin system AbiEi family antitoxin domain-containing protein [Candidatus Berkiella cookevillensis]MCS5707342.1 AbiEi antitoxin N-terminal domain-containing protein [Candidatus Berkiella cookevillensis]
MKICDYAHKALSLAKANKVLRSTELSEQGIPRVILTRLTREGKLVRIGRGLYALPNRSISENESLLEVATRSSQGVFCLLTALRFHKLTTQSPFEVWLAIPNKAQPPQINTLSLRIIRLSKEALEEGIETHMQDGIPIRVYCIAKTIADCFKFRNKIGLDVALEALQEAWRGKKIQMDELWHYARICKVEKIIRPYIESLP